MNRDIRTSVDNDLGIRTASQRIDDATTHAEKVKKEIEFEVEGDKVM